MNNRVSRYGGWKTKRRIPWIETMEDHVRRASVYHFYGVSGIRWSLGFIFVAGAGTEVTVTQDNIDSEYQLVVTATTTKLIVVSSSLSIVVQGLRINQPVRRRRKLGLAIHHDISRGPIGKFHRCDTTADTLDHSNNMREGQGKGSSLREIGLEDEKFKKKKKEKEKKKKEKN
ncbi:LOW QUALITY PROTEIN: hypothetical protein V1478_008041 [Vespula squamosa]|uniref:Uncharacterized protein n=1 Tax=Vespula squamosa TaxID=30214 RepID=A0ABD2AXM5_VESSQ